MLVLRDTRHRMRFDGPGRPLLGLRSSGLGLLLVLHGCILILSVAIRAGDSPRFLKASAPIVRTFEACFAFTTNMTRGLARSQSGTPISKSSRFRYLQCRSVSYRLERPIPVGRAYRRCKAPPDSSRAKRIHKAVRGKPPSLSQMTDR